MNVDYLRAKITVDVDIDIIFPEGTLDKIQREADAGNQEIVNRHRDILKNQMNMQLHELPRTMKVKWSNVDAIIERE